MLGVRHQYRTNLRSKSDHPGSYKVGLPKGAPRWPMIVVKEMRRKTLAK